MLALFAYIYTRPVSEQMTAYVMARCYNKLDDCIGILNNLLESKDFSEDETEEDVNKELKLALKMKEELKDYNFLANNY